MRGGIKFASIKVRIIATLIDFFITASICIIVFFIPSNYILHIFNEMGKQINVGVLESIFLIIVYFVFITIFIVYYTIALGRFGITLGKMLFKIKIVDNQYKRITYKVALKRTILLILYISIGYGILWRLFDENMQSIYDKKLNLNVIYY